LKTNSQLIQAILEREFQSLNAQSTAQGLTLDDMRKLDLLIKAEKSFGKEIEKEPESTGNLSDEELLEVVAKGGK